MFEVLGKGEEVTVNAKERILVKKGGALTI